MRAQTKAVIVRNSYIEQMPGMDSRADAYNLVQAVRNGDHLMARMIVEHQIEPDGAEDILATVVTWYVIMLRAMNPDDADHVMDHIREMSTCER